MGKRWLILCMRTCCVWPCSCSARRAMWLCMPGSPSWKRPGLRSMVSRNLKRMRYTPACSYNDTAQCLGSPLMPHITRLRFCLNTLIAGCVAFPAKCLPKLAAAARNNSQPAAARPPTLPSPPKAMLEADDDLLMDLEAPQPAPGGQLIDFEWWPGAAPSSLCGAALSCPSPPPLPLSIPPCDPTLALFPSGSTCDTRTLQAPWHLQTRTSRTGARPALLARTRTPLYSRRPYTALSTLR